MLGRATGASSAAPALPNVSVMTAVGTASRAGASGPHFAGVLVAAQAGAAWALRELYDTYAPAVSGYARAQGCTDAEGLANDVFARGFRRLNDFTGDEPALRSWLFTIAHHAIVDERRRLARRVREAGPPTDRDLRETAASAETAALVGLEHQGVLDVLRRLPDDQREVLTLRILGDLTVAQVAQVQGRSIGAVKALQRRGLNRLRRIIEQGVPL